MAYSMVNARESLLQNDLSLTNKYFRLFISYLVQTYRHGGQSFLPFTKQTLHFMN